MKSTSLKRITLVLPRTEIQKITYTSSNPKCPCNVIGKVLMKNTYFTLQTFRLISTLTRREQKYFSQ